jgi:hypothetical protein
VGEYPPIFERRTAIRAVSVLMRPGFPVSAGERRPIVVFEGTGGSGKTALLDVLVGKVDQYVPYGRVDFAEPQHEDVAHTLSVVAGRLSRYRPRYGRLRFPRLLMGLLVMEQDLSEYSFQDAHDAVSRLLKQRHNSGWPQRFLGRVAGEVTVSADIAAVGTGSLIRLPLQLVAELGGFTFTSKTQRWFGHRDRGLHDRAVDTLVEFNTNVRDARADDTSAARVKAARDQVAGLHCEALQAQSHIHKNQPTRQGKN